MKQTQVIINNALVSVQALFYISNNNYYAIYTDGETDDNDFIILHIIKILQEVINTQNGPQASGYLIGVTVADEEEYSRVQEEIKSIIVAKQGGQDANVQFVDPSILGQIKIRDTKIFRFKKDMFEQTFGKIETTNTFNNTQSETNGQPNIVNNSTESIETNNNQELDKKKIIQDKLDNIIEQINEIKNTLT